MDYDIIIIGSGLAGTLAAINAAKTKKVAVIRKGYGATALSSGAFDIAGKTGERGRPFKDFINIPSGIGQILENKANHPYSILSKAFKVDRFNEVKRMIQVIGAEFFESLSANGVSYQGSWESNILLPTQQGTFKVTSFCQSSMLSGNLTRLMGRPILFLGFKTTATHNKKRAEFLKDILSTYGFLSFKNISYMNIDMGSAGLKWDRHDFIELAGMMDDIDSARKLADQIKYIMNKQGSDHVFIPPIMGIARHKEVLDLFRDSFGDAVSELLAAPPSAPGLRLQYALDRLLLQHGIKIIDGEARCGDRPDTIKSMEVVSKSGQSELMRAGSFVLATGKFISTGIVNNKIWQESIFKLPVFIDNYQANDPSALKYLTGDPFDEQRIFSMGVKTDEQLRPVDEDGKVIYKNLYAAGSILSGYNYIYDKTGMGTALITGAKAGLFSAG